MAFSIELGGLILLEGEVAALQIQQGLAPSTFKGAQPFAVKFQGIPGGTMTTQQLGARLQALLLAVQNLPQ